MKFVMVSLGWVFGAGAGLACSAIELGPCDAAPVAPDGLLAPYRQACTGAFAIEEFAVTPSASWRGLPAKGWVLDPNQMACNEAPICQGDACTPVLALPDPDCLTGMCWDRKPLVGAELVRAD